VGRDPATCSFRVGTGCGYSEPPPGSGVRRPVSLSIPALAIDALPLFLHSYPPTTPLPLRRSSSVLTSKAFSSVIGYLYTAWIAIADAMSGTKAS